MARKPSQVKRRAEVRSFLSWLKETRGCGECGDKFPGEPFLLEFDHHDAADKPCEPTQLINRYHAWDSIVRALSNTAIRCGPCHKRRTHTGTPLAESECMGEETVRMALEEWRKR